MGRERSASVPAILAAGLGLLFAAWLYGARALDPASAAWLLQGDPAQHYVGSVFFLQEGWHWPPGRIAGFGADPTSVVFTDAIPLVALLAKLLGVTPGLQYFGLWMALCHALSGWFGVRLLRRVGVQGTGMLLMGALFFITAPVLLLRAYGHEALMAQFLVLAALDLALAPWRFGPWLVLVAIATLVHPYLALMTGALGAAAALGALALRELRWPRLVLEGAGGLAVLAAVAWLAGYFVGEGEVSAAGHGFFSANLNTWFNPMDWAHFMRFDPELHATAREWTRWLPALKQATGGQYEGFAYFGAGALGALLLSSAAFFVRREGEPQPPAVAPRARWIALWTACLLLAALALSARPSAGATIFFELPVEGFAAKLLGVFRASGRFVWPVTYLALALALRGLGRLRWPGPILAALLLVQVADLNHKFHELRDRFRSGPPHIQPVLQAPLWGQALARCPRLEFISEAQPAPRWVAPALAAGLAGAQFAPAPTARHSAQVAARRLQETVTLLATGAWRSDTVYVLEEPLPGTGIVPVLNRVGPQHRHLQVDGYDLVMPLACLER